MNKNREFACGTTVRSEGGRVAWRTVGLAVAVMAVPATLTCLAVFGWKMLGEPSASPAVPVSFSHTGTAYSTNVTPCAKEDLFSERDRVRLAGESPDAINRKIWMRQATDPVELFHVTPPAVSPQGRKAWRWTFTQNARFVVASAVAADAAGRRYTGLYDLVEDVWMWSSLLPWPEDHERPFVMAGRLLLAYTKRGHRFMLCVAPDGRIIGIDRLDAGKTAPSCTPLEDGGIQVVDNIRFCLSADGSLTGRAALPFPGYMTDPHVLEVFHRERPMLNEEVAESYADLLDNLRRCSKDKPFPAPVLALRAQIFLVNQAWTFAAESMKRMLAIQQKDHRAPRVNPLMLARCLILAGQEEGVDRLCFDALQNLASDPSAYHAEARAELERLYRRSAVERKK